VLTRAAVRTDLLDPAAVVVGDSVAEVDACDREAGFDQLTEPVLGGGPIVATILVLKAAVSSADRPSAWGR
jgi:hypothetical protein